VCAARAGTFREALVVMARGSKKSYTAKQKRQAEHIEESAKKSGKSSKTAARIAWASVNKQDGGGKKSGSGRGSGKRDTSSSRKGGRKGGKAARRTKRSTKARSSSRRGGRSKRS
jgi:hypothetical protein